MKKKLAIIGSVGVPANYGGFETLAQQLVDHLDEQFDITVYCSKKSYTERPTHYKKAKLVYWPLRANGYQSVPYDVLSVVHAAFSCDTLLVLGTPGGLIMPFVRMFSKKKLVLHVDGIEWRRDKWKKFAKAFLRFSENWSVRFAHDVIVDNEVIRKYIRNVHKREGHLITYGADHVVCQHSVSLDQFAFANQKYAFTVCRIVPENNLRMILEAFQKHGKIPMVAVGNWKNSTYGLRLLEMFKDVPNLHLLDPIYDQELLDSLRKNCHLYIHGHSAGGTNPSLVEAMYLNLPIVAYDVNFNRATMENKGMYFRNSDGLYQQLAELDAESLAKARTELKSVADRKYRWNLIAEAYAQVF